MISVLIPTHTLGKSMAQFIDSILDKMGLSHAPTLETIIYIVLIVGLAIFMGWVVRITILKIAKKLVELHPTDVGKELLRERVFSKCSHIIPPLVFLTLVPFAFEGEPHTLRIIDRIVWVYFLIAFGMGLNSVLTFIWVHFNSHDNENKHPLRGLLNTGHGIVWIVITIIALSIIFDKSPMALLAGLGAFAAALMLIFKDSILGLVAGIQLSQNDMLRVGDWIVVPSTPANGIVEDVSLTTVKVRNFDNTMIMLPPYTLVSTSFQNWRGMFEAGGRQIARCVWIDNNSIVAASDDFVEEMVQRFPKLAPFVDQCRQKGVVFDASVAPVNGTVDTNVGLFRAYLGIYLRNHPQIVTDNYLLVRLQAPEDKGTPLQIFCYSKITSWTGYEAVQSQIFEHIAVTAPIFGLKIFNGPDGNHYLVEKGNPSSAAPTSLPSTDADKVQAK